MQKGARGLCAILALLFCLGTWTVSAASLNMVLGNAVVEDGVLTLTGNLTEAGVRDLSVTVFMITDLDMSLFDYESMTDEEIQQNQMQLIAENRLLDMTEIKTNAKGEFQYSLDLKRFAPEKVGEKDYIRVSVRAAEMDSPVSATGYYSSASDEEDALKAVAESSKEDMLAYLTGQVEQGKLPIVSIFGLEITAYYSLLSDAGKAEVAGAIAGQSYGSKEQVLNAFDVAVEKAARKEINFGSAYHKGSKVDIYDLVTAMQLVGQSYKVCPEADVDMNKTILESDVNAVMEMILSSH